MEKELVFIQKEVKNYLLPKNMQSLYIGQIKDEKMVEKNLVSFQEKNQILK